jgi:hypothetical protein
MWGKIATSMSERTAKKDDAARKLMEMLEDRMLR